MQKSFNRHFSMQSALKALVITFALDVWFQKPYKVLKFSYKVKKQLSEESTALEDSLYYNCIHPGPMQD